LSGGIPNDSEPFSERLPTTYLENSAVGFVLGVPLQVEAAAEQMTLLLRAVGDSGMGQEPDQGADEQQADNGVQDDRGVL
jgi:hypothetical protein